MNYKVVISSTFKKVFKRLYKKYPSLKREIEDLILTLQQTPRKGVSMGSNTYKMRLRVSSKNTGKSGGIRVITMVSLSQNQVVLASIYDKSNKEDLTKDELKRLYEQALTL